MEGEIDVVQKKLPLINSAHGSETRNIINELIKLFNSMGYTYDEALKKAHDTLKEAKKTNDMNKDVQSQVNKFISEFESTGETNFEVVQARTDIQGYEHSVIHERLLFNERGVLDLAVNVIDYIDSSQHQLIKSYAESQDSVLITKGIEVAIAVLKSNNGGILYFPPGLYKVTNLGTSRNDNHSLLLDFDNVTIKGSGKSSIIKSDNNADSIVFALGKSGTKMYKNLVLEDFIVDGNWDNQTWAGPIGKEAEGVYDQNGISVKCFENISVKNVQVREVAQDGITFATCKNIILYPDVEVADCGKGNLTFFMCANYTVFNGTYINPNSSPSNKELYTTASDGYPAIGVAYAPNEAMLNESKNNAKIIYPTIKLGSNGRGRGIMAAWDFTDVHIVSPNIEVSGDNGHCISINKYQSDKYVRTSLLNPIIKSRNTARNINILGVDDLIIRDVDIDNSNDSVNSKITSCENVTIENSDFKSDIYISDCGVIDINKVKTEYNIIFEAHKTDVLRIVNSKYSIVNRVNVGTIIEPKDRKILKGSVLRSNNIASKSSQILEVQIPGVTTNDIIIGIKQLGSFSPDISKIIVSAQIVNDNLVNLMFYNPGEVQVNPGSREWEVYVEKNNF